MAQTQQFQVLHPEQIRTGMEIRVHQHISEQTAKGMKDRIQVYEGLVITVRGKGIHKTMTVRKVSDGVGVEKIFPLALPTIEKIELVRQLKVARKNIGFLRDVKKRMKEIKPKLRPVAEKVAEKIEEVPVVEEVVAEAEPVVKEAVAEETKAE